LTGGPSPGRGSLPSPPLGEGVSGPEAEGEGVEAGSAFPRSPRLCPLFFWRDLIFVKPFLRESHLLFFPTYSMEPSEWSDPRARDATGARGGAGRGPHATAPRALRRPVPPAGRDGRGGLGRQSLHTGEGWLPIGHGSYGLGLRTTTLHPPPFENPTTPPKPTDRCAIPLHAMPIGCHHRPTDPSPVTRRGGGVGGVQSAPASALGYAREYLPPELDGGRAAGPYRLEGPHMNPQGHQNPSPTSTSP